MVRTQARGSRLVCCQRFVQAHAPGRMVLLLHQSLSRRGPRWPASSVWPACVATELRLACVLSGPGHDRKSSTPALLGLGMRHGQLALGRPGPQPLGDGNAVAGNTLLRWRTCCLEASAKREGEWPGPICRIAGLLGALVLTWQSQGSGRATGESTMTLFLIVLE